jgi:phosphate transport system permease protein
VIPRDARPRKLMDRAVKVSSSLAAFVGIFFLAWILWVVVREGGGAIDWAFFTELPAPPGVEGGGVSSAIFGTLVITLIATILGVPIGLLAGVYLSEFGRATRLGALVRFNINVLMGVPSIIIGLFVYTMLVKPVQHFSGYAGAVALAIIMLPVVARTTEDMLTLVPNSLRESALALGAPRWKVTLDIVFRAAKSGLVTGTLLAVARISGETAPLLFTALNSPYWPRTLAEPMANLTVTIFNYAMSPFKVWQEIAWGASLVIMVAVLALNLLARLGLSSRRRGARR